MTYRVELTPKALQMLSAVGDRSEQARLLDRIAELAHEPEAQGKALVGELRGLRSVRAAGQRYRIVYRVRRGEVLVLVVGVGRRKAGDKRDVYGLVQRLSPAERS